MVEVKIERLKLAYVGRRNGRTPVSCSNPVGVFHSLTVLSTPQLRNLSPFSPPKHSPDALPLWAPRSVRISVRCCKSWMMISEKAGASTAIPERSSPRDSKQDENRTKAHDMRTSVPTRTRDSSQRFRSSDEDFHGIRVSFEASDKGFGEHPLDFRRV